MLTRAVVLCHEFAAKLPRPSGKQKCRNSSISNMNFSFTHLFLTE